MNDLFNNGNKENEVTPTPTNDSPSSSEFDITFDTTENGTEEAEPVEKANTEADTTVSSTEKKEDYTYQQAEPKPHTINMQYKPRKTPTWVTVLVCVIGGLWLIISAALISAYVTHRVIEKPGNNNTFENIIEENKVEEHLEISDSPMSEGAKTTDGALTVKQVSEKVRKSVVGVTCQGSSNFSSQSVGSGIIMSADGYIITNNHVIEGMTTINVVLDDGKTYSARLIGADSRTDLAVIKIEAKDLPAAEFGDSDKLEQGDPAIAIGNPAGLQLQNTVTYGIISAINRDIVVEDRTMTLIQTDASINPGNSGGPLVNEFGQVIGINTIKVGISYYEGLGFAIPMNTAKPIIDELISRGYVKGRPSIGINGTTLSERDSMFYGLPAGLIVEYVHPYSDAFKKGLRRGDIIIKMNGTALSSTAEIKKIRDNFTAGDTVTLTIYRNSEEIDLDVILMDEAVLSSSAAEAS